MTMHISSKKSFLELWVGLFVLGGILAVVLLTFRVGGTGAFTVERNYQVYANFDNIGGLTIKAPVTIAGVNVGRVSGITVNLQQFSARVEMSILEEFDNIPVDSSARILTAGLLGAQYIGLEQGAEDIFLKNGDTLDITQSAFSLEDIIGQFLFKATTGN